MNKKTFIHIGLQKTGSTAIQSFLTENRLVLKSQGFEYIDPNKSKIGFQGHNHSHLSFSLTGYWIPMEHQLTKDEAWCELKQLALKSDTHTIVSSELLSTPQILPYVGFIKDCLRGIDVRIVIYLRRQDALAQSIYKERIKNSESRPFEEVYAIGDYQQILDFKTTLDVWCQHFSRDNIIIRPYEQKQLKKGDIIEDFLSVLGVDLSEKFKRGIKYVNTTENAHFLEISRELNALLHPSYPGLNELKQWIKRQLRSAIVDPFSNNDLISPAFRKTILESFSADNEYIAKDFLGRKDGILFREPGPDLSQDWQPYSGLPAKDAAIIFKQIFDKEKQIRGI